MQSDQRIRLLLWDNITLYSVYLNSCLWTTVYQQLERCWFGNGLSPSFPHQLPVTCFEWPFPFTFFKHCCWSGTSWPSTFSILYPFIGHSGKAYSCRDGTFMLAVQHQQRGFGPKACACPYLVLQNSRSLLCLVPDWPRSDERAAAGAGPSPTAAAGLAQGTAPAKVLPVAPGTAAPAPAAWQKWLLDSFWWAWESSEWAATSHKKGVDQASWEAGIQQLTPKPLAADLAEARLLRLSYSLGWWRGPLQCGAKERWAPSPPARQLPCS